MSIRSIQVDTTQTDILLATREIAVMTVMLCNTTAVEQVVSLYAVKSGSAASDSNVIIKEYTIPAKDTYVWSGNEKFIIDEGDSISAIAASAASVTATIVYKQI